MKVLIDHSQPFLLAHGGVQRQIESTRTALERLGLEVEFLRWWDDKQRGDLIHFFGKPVHTYLSQARDRHIPVVLTSFFSAACNRSKSTLGLQRIASRALKTLSRDRLSRAFGWDNYHLCAQNVVGLQAEQQVLECVHDVPRERIAVVPLGVSDAYLQHTKTAEGSGAHLICVGTIRDIKRSVELAKAAHAAQVPLLFVGKPYSETSGYWNRFRQLVDGKFVKHESHVDSEEEMVRLLKGARGFVLMSDYENWCLAAHEAAAVGLPLLLRDLPWSRERFGTAAQYFKKDEETAVTLRSFYERSASLPRAKVHVPSWDDTARCLKNVYEKVLSRGADSRN